MATNGSRCANGRDSIFQSLGNMPSGTDVDTLRAAGSWRIADWKSRDITGLPDWAYNWGQLVVFESYQASYQLLLNDDANSTIGVRSSWAQNNGWKPWRKITPTA